MDRGGQWWTEVDEGGRRWIEVDRGECRLTEVNVGGQRETEEDRQRGMEGEGGGHRGQKGRGDRGESAAAPAPASPGLPPKCVAWVPPQGNAASTFCKGLVTFPPSVEFFHNYKLEKWGSFDERKQHRASESAVSGHPQSKAGGRRGAPRLCGPGATEGGPRGMRSRTGGEPCS